jgi:ribosomal protein S18 acetylase RimI-like enzyme
VTIRRAGPGDVAALAAINHEVQALHRAARPDRYADPSVEAIAAAVRTQLAAPDAVVLVADRDGDVVGYAVVTRVDRPGHTYALPRRTAHVDQLGVAGRARRGGVGRALMAAVEAQARAWGAAAVTLDVQAFNPEAIAFYAALGYDTATLRMSRDRL